MSKSISIPNELILDKIYVIRDQKVMLDKDLAMLFGVETKRLKERVRRSINRFPSSFMFELTTTENKILRSQFASLQQNQHFRYPPFAFTEHGILMLSSILNSEIAIKMSIQIIETFVELRKLANNYEEILAKIEKMESKNNEQFSEIYSVIKQLLSQPEDKQRTKIGYKKR